MYNLIIAYQEENLNTNVAMLAFADNKEKYTKKC